MWSPEVATYCWKASLQLNTIKCDVELFSPLGLESSFSVYLKTFRVKIKAFNVSTIACLRYQMQVHRIYVIYTITEL